MRSGGEIDLNKALFGDNWRSASGGGSSPGGAAPSSGGAVNHMADIKTMQTNQGIGQAASMAFKAVGDVTTSAIGHAMKMSAMRHQESMQNRAWSASVQAIKEESHLVDDINLINKNKIRLGYKFVRSQKDSTIADARFLEAKKTEKAMQKANKALVKKALTDRRRRFYGKTA